MKEVDLLTLASALVIWFSHKKDGVPMMKRQTPAISLLLMSSSPVLRPGSLRSEPGTLFLDTKIRPKKI